MKLDVMDFMWHEMYNACITRRSPPYAPYVFALIVSKSENVRKGLSAMKLTKHKPKGLHIKTHNPPLAEDGTEIPNASDSGDDEGIDLRSRYVVSRRQKEAEPSWVKRLESNIYKVFCFQKDIEKRAYKTHVKIGRASCRERVLRLV